MTYNPATARKQAYTFESKLEELRRGLIEMRRKVREKAPHWRKGEEIWERYLRLCERLHMPSDLYKIEITSSKKELSMSFRKNSYRVDQKRALFGKNIIITDNRDWTTEEIIEASLSRWRVEDDFRQSKDDDLVSVQPIRHFRDSKIRCHLFACVVAMTYLVMLRRRLEAKGIKTSVQSVMEEMARLHSILAMNARRRQVWRELEMPTKTQSEVLKAFGYYIDESGGLQELPG